MDRGSAPDGDFGFRMSDVGWCGDHVGTEPIDLKSEIRHPKSIFTGTGGTFPVSSGSHSAAPRVSARSPGDPHPLAAHGPRLRPRRGFRISDVGCRVVWRSRRNGANTPEIRDPTSEIHLHWYRRYFSRIFRKSFSGPSSFSSIARGSSPSCSAWTAAPPPTGISDFGCRMSGGVAITSERSQYT